MAQRNVIHRALASHLYDNFSSALTVAWENTKYDPGDLTTIWFEEVFLPNDSAESSVGKGGTQLDFGLYQINVRVPINTGTIESDNYIEELSQLYSIGTILTKDGEEIFGKRCR